MPFSLLRASVTAVEAGAPDPQPGDPATVLIDGADTPVTANGLPGYVPTPGDRLLVGLVGGQLEVVQFLSRGTVPYLTGEDISDLAAQVDANTQGLVDASTALTQTSTDLTDYQNTTDTVLGGLQGAYDVLTGIGDAGVDEDYFWVGDDPVLSTLKLVQISPFVQSVLYAGDYATLSTLLHLWDQDDLGDVTYQGALKPPKTTFYNAIVASGRSAMAI